jgi:hypothetical protein
MFLLFIFVSVFNNFSSIFRHYPQNCLNFSLHTFLHEKNFPPNFPFSKNPFALKTQFHLENAAAVNYKNNDTKRRERS